MQHPRAQLFPLVPSSFLYSLPITPRAATLIIRPSYSGPARSALLPKRRGDDGDIMQRGKRHTIPLQARQTLMLVRDEGTRDGSFPAERSPGRPAVSQASEMLGADWIMRESLLASCPIHHRARDEAPVPHTANEGAASCSRDRLEPNCLGTSRWMISKG